MWVFSSTNERNPQGTLSIYHISSQFTLFLLSIFIWTNSRFTALSMRIRGLCFQFGGGPMTMVLFSLLLIFTLFSPSACARLDFSFTKPSCKKWKRKKRTHFFFFVSFVVKLTLCSLFSRTKFWSSEMQLQRFAVDVIGPPQLDWVFSTWRFLAWRLVIDVRVAATVANWIVETTG